MTDWRGEEVAAEYNEVIFYCTVTPDIESQDRILNYRVRISV